MDFLLSIGEMAKINGISIQRLRYYDKIGLFSPDHIDEKSGYRYYKMEQSGQLGIIQELQYIGLRLSEIKKILTDQDADQLLQILEQSIEETRRKQARIERIKRIQKRYLDSASASKCKYESGKQIRELKDRRILALKETKDCLVNTDIKKEQLARMELQKKLAGLGLSQSYLHFWGIRMRIKNNVKYYSYYIELPQRENEGIGEVVAGGRYLEFYCDESTLLQEVDLLVKKEVFIDFLPNAFKDKHRIYIVRYA